MITTTSLHPAAYFAVLAAISGYLYLQQRQSHIMLWGLGWTVLVARQLSTASRAADSAVWAWTDIVLISVGGALLLLSGLLYAGRTRFGLARAGIFGAALGVLTGALLGGIALVRDDAWLPSTAALCFLAACWIGTGWLMHRSGRLSAPIGARLAGSALAAWGLFQPLAWALAARPDWPARFFELEEVLATLVAVGMLITRYEEARTSFAASAVSRRRIFDQDPNMIAVMQDDRLVFVNRALEQRAKLKMEDRAAGTLFDRVTPEYRAEAAERHDARMRGELVPDYELEFLDANGERVAVVVHAMPIVWNERPAFQYELLDVTTRKRAEAEVRGVNAELQRINAELERANRLQTEFLSNTSHELKTPLTSIMSNTEILEYEMCGPVNEEQRRVLANINRNSQNLLEMITELLDFARQRTDRDVLRRETVRFDTLLAGVLETVRPLADEKDLRLEVDLAETPRCWLDGEKIYRVYLNLVENAIKFSSQGVIRMAARNVDGELEGSVTDEGIGIPAEQLEAIFEAFRQVDASSTRSYPGVGLGLAICRQLIELHGGRIWAESVPGRGSTFRFRVPCLAPPPDVAPAPAGEG